MKQRLAHLSMVIPPRIFSDEAHGAGCSVSFLQAVITGHECPVSIPETVTTSELDMPLIPHHCSSDINRHVFPSILHCRMCYMPMLRPMNARVITEETSMIPW